MVPTSLRLTIFIFWAQQANRQASRQALRGHSVGALSLSSILKSLKGGSRPSKQAGLFIFFISERNYNEIKTMAYVIGNGLKWQKSCHTSGAGPEMYQGNVISES